MRLVIKNLFDITENVAMKEINADTKGYIQRETIDRFKQN